MAPPARLHDYRVLVKVLRPGSAAHRARTVVRQVLQAAGVDDEGVSDAESAVAELAANAETHARRPYELRIVTVDGLPAWCEVVDGDEDLADIPRILRELRTSDPFTLWLRESGRGLLMVHRLSAGRCGAYRTRTYATGIPGKAVAFALPMKTSPPSGSPVPEGGLPQEAGTATSALVPVPASI
ncbi:ATP-binding protein [Microbispora sp. H10949]|uniref:ATP-binding protein n=1 Tax=Microbispora sp. H10949 TaxID=2729111 RepID=UPI0016032FBA|nr:ATP-binding protein [Microbispora sp. H10949]